MQEVLSCQLWLLNGGICMKNNLIRNNKGITLVELLISLSIAIVILGLIFSLFFFGNTTYSSGTTQNNIQTDLRLASDIIRDNVRYASDLTVINTDGTGLDANLNYVYLSSDSQSIKLKLVGESAKNIINFSGTDYIITTSFSKNGVTGNAVVFSNSISAKSTVSQVLKYTITGNSPSKNKTYNISNEVNLPNMQSTLTNLSFLDGPIASPGEGEVSIGTVVNLSSVSGSTIYYTLDGSTPTTTSTTNGSNNVNITISTNTVIKAITVHNGQSSQVAIYEYTLSPPKPIASDVLITGTNRAGQTLTVTYTFIANGGPSQGASEIVWKKIKDGNGSVSVVKTSYYNPSGTNVFTYSVSNGDKKDTIYVEVKPINSDNRIGDIVESNRVIILNN